MLGYGVAQTLWFARITAETLVTEGFRPEPAKQMLEMLQNAITEVRTIAYGLRPPVLTKIRAIGHFPYMRTV